MALVANTGGLGLVVRSLRMQQQLTQAELAVKAHVSRAFVIKLESGQNPRLEYGRVFDVVSALGYEFTVTPKPTFPDNPVFNYLNSLGG